LFSAEFYNILEDLLYLLLVTGDLTVFLTFSFFVAIFVVLC